jgi:hypothetical protein
MKCAFIQRNKLVWPVSIQCYVLLVSASGYHEHLARRLDITGRRHPSDEALLVHISAVYAENRGAYGWPRIWRELVRRGVRVGKQRVQRLMQKHGIHARGKRKFRVITTDSKHNLPIAPNVPDRNFTPAMGGRLHLHRHRRRMVVSGCSHRLIQPQGYWLADAAGYASRSGDRCVGYGLVQAQSRQAGRADLS